MISIVPVTDQLLDVQPGSMQERHVRLEGNGLTVTLDRCLVLLEVKQCNAAIAPGTCIVGLESDGFVVTVNSKLVLFQIDYSGTDGVVQMTLLDHFGFTDVDLIKIDCEGYEYPILKGACETLQNNDAVIIVEQKPHKTDQYTWGQYAAVEYLIDVHGYRIVDRVVDDWILKKLPKKGA